MRILKWSLLVLLVVILIPVAGFSALLGGLWSYDLKVEKGSFWLETIKERTGYDIVVSSPVYVKIGQEFSLLGENIHVRAVEGASTQNLAEIGSLDVYGDLSFGLLWGEQPTLSTLNGKDITLNLQRNANGKMILPRVAALLQKEAPTDFIISSALAEEKFSFEEIPVEDIDVKNVQINVVSPDEPALSIALAAMKAHKPIGNSDGFLRMEGAFNNTPIAADAAITTRGAISGGIQFAGIDVQLSGQALGKVDIDSTIQIADTVLLSRLLSQPLPEGPFQVKSETRYESGVIQIALERFQSKNSLLKGQINFNPQRRALTADLKGAKLDIADFQPKPTGGSAKAAMKTDDGKVIPDVDLPAILLKKHLLPEFADAEIDIEVGAFRADKVLLEDVKLKIIANDHGAEIDIDKATIGLGGQIAGQLGIKVGKEPKVVTDLRLESTPISTFQPFAPIISRLDGVLNLELKGSTSGTNLRALAAGYSGDVSFSLYDGYVHLPDSAAKLLATIAPTILEEGLLVVKCADFQSTLEDGVDQRFDGVLLSQAMLAYGGGTVNLGAEEVNLMYQNELSVLGATMGLPLGVKGAFAAPKFKPDLKALIAAKKSKDVPMPERQRSVCHNETASNIKGSYSAATSMLKLDGLGNLTDISAIKDTVKAKVQDKIQQGVSKIKAKAVEKVIEQSLDGGGVAAKAQELIGENLGGGSSKTDSLKEAGKALLGGLKF